MTSTTDTGPDDLLIDRIVAEYEPIVARTRRLMTGVWLDRRLSKTNLVVLMQLDCHGPVSMGRLAGMLDATLPNVTGIVTRMEELGYVERIRDDHDRRVVLVRATDLGREAMEELESMRRQHLRLLVTELDPDDREVCLRAFRALREAADRLDRGDPTGTPTG